MVLAKVKIGDFEQFWSVFTTAGAEQRRKFGSRGSQVFRSQQDPNEVMALFDWANEDYERFISDPETREIFASAGLQSLPEHVFIERVGEVDS